MKTASEIRLYFLEHAQRSLLRPSMYGGETGILQFLGHLAFIEERGGELAELRSELQLAGSFNARGVTGAFEQLLGFHCQDAYIQSVASVYARIAFIMGWLTEPRAEYLKRLLSVDEFLSMLDRIKAQPEMEPCDPDAIIGKFGEPTICWRSNDNYPCTLLYLCGEEPSRYIYFDFWSEWYKDEKGIQLPGKYGPKPLLRNIRVPAEKFTEEFIWTSFGVELLKGRKQSQPPKPLWKNREPK